ncbi:pilus assembly protein PilP [Pseudomonas sp. p1(2021b)]|uniref:pilus assembly protein PilP n=1 Tax=Pseudomonas sp. p1(2021b) TaxID=2874628 RepID=UPI001CCA51E6|nr:pilus assembly protein PilP [Pseudomonas sp. p1(2021b)]UBM25065.1 pilus assembly protein PilP [Pseudomonas sp. p1(2021b)]
MKGLGEAQWSEWVGRSRGVMVLAPGLLMLAVFLLGWRLFLQENHRALQQGETSADGLRLVHERKAQAARQLQPATEALADVQRQLLDARWRLSAGEDMSDLLDGLASSGHALGLVFEQLDVLPEGAGPGYRVVPLEIQVIGTYPALRSWLQAWLDQVRLLRPTQLELTGVQGRPGVRRLSLQVESYHPAEALAAPASLAHEPARSVAQPASVDLFAPWSMQKPPRGLAGVALAQVEMVGSLSRNGRNQALLQAAGRLYRVGEGDRLGRDQGIVVAVSGQQIEVRERVFVAGAWHERTAYLRLRKQVGNEVMDERERAGEMDAGDTPDGPGQHGAGQSE